MAFQGLANENNSVFSLTFEEFQNILGDPGAKFGSMNMDELLRNIWTAEENQAAMAFEGPNTAGMNSGINSSVTNNSGIVSQLSIQRQGSLCLPRTLSTRTVEEVWKSLNIQPEIREGEGVSNASLQTRQITLGEVTLEDFLVKAGIVQKPPIPQEENHKPGNEKNKKEEEDSSSSSSHQFVGSTITNLMGGSIQPNLPTQGFNFPLDQSLLRSPHNQQAQQGFHQTNVSVPFLAQQQQHQPQPPKETSDVKACSPHHHQQAYHQMNIPFLTQQQYQQSKEASDGRSSSTHHQQGYHQLNMNAPFIAQQHQQPKEASDVRANSPLHQQAQQGFHQMTVNVPFMNKQPKESSDVSYGGGVLETSPRPLSTTTMGGVLSSTGGNTGVWLSGMRYGVASSPISPRTEDSSPTYATNGQVNRHGRKRCSEAPVEKVIERRQRRMIKNRESAARSRARKQAYTMELEAEVSHLKEENMKLLQKQQEEADRRKKQIIAQAPLVVKAGGRIATSTSSSSALRRTCTGPW